MVRREIRRRYLFKMHTKQPSVTHFDGTGPIPDWKPDGEHVVTPNGDVIADCPRDHALLISLAPSMLACIRSMFDDKGRVSVKPATIEAASRILKIARG